MPQAPAPLAKEVESYLEDIRTGNDPWAKDDAVMEFRKVLPKKPRSVDTVRTGRHGIRALLWGAHQAGVPMRQLNGLRVNHPGFVGGSNS